MLTVLAWADRLIHQFGLEDSLRVIGDAYDRRLTGVLNG